MFAGLAADGKDFGGDATDFVFVENFEFRQREQPDFSRTGIGQQGKAGIAIEADGVMSVVAIHQAGADRKSFHNLGIVEVAIAIGIEIDDGQFFLGVPLQLVLEHEGIMFPGSGDDGFQGCRRETISDIERDFQDAGCSGGRVDKTESRGWPASSRA